MILADTSAWIEYLRATGSATDLSLGSLIAADDGQLAVTEVVVMELLAGASLDAEAARLGRLLGRFPLVPIEGLADFEAAAGLSRACRLRGEAVRSLIDSLVAAVAIRAEAAVLHRNRDFQAIARAAPLRLAG